MRRLPNTIDKLQWLFARLGIGMAEIDFLDAADEIDRRCVKNETSFEAELWIWWQKHMGGYPIAHDACRSCGREFADYQERGREFCCESCKKRDENARWYASHTQERIRQAQAYRRWSKIPQSLPDPTPDQYNEIVLILGSESPDLIETIWKWMVFQDVDAKTAMVELSGLA